MNRHCQIRFLPVVHLEGLQATSPTKPAANIRAAQRLTCRSDIPGWATCPQMRAFNETLSVDCDPLGTNTYRCKTSHDTVKTRCRIFETCDQAVLISGGWNREHSGLTTTTNLKLTYGMLQKHGFSDTNINVFYANGVNKTKGKSTQFEFIYIF